MVGDTETKRKALLTTSIGMNISNLNNPNPFRMFMTGIMSRDAETKIITISLPKEFLSQIDKARGVESRSSFLRRAAAEFMK